MVSDRLEIHLESVNEKQDWEYETRLRIVAYLEENESFNENTLIFDCDPVGSNYNRTYLKAEFPNKEAIANIRRFLVHHLDQNDDIERSRQVPVVNAKRVNTSARGGRREDEDFDYIRLMADSERISFGPLSTMTPDIQFYEKSTVDGAQDRRNAERLLDFFSEITKSTSKKSDVSLHDKELTERSLPLFEDGKYPEAARLAGQILEERVNESVPESLADRSGADLIRRAFSPEGGPLQLASNNGEQKGIMSLFVGAYQGIRNPLSHRTPDSDGEKYLDGLDQIQTRNILHLVDYLLTTLERRQEKPDDGTNQ